jgi:hypothetical protein
MLRRRAKSPTQLTSPPRANAFAARSRILSELDREELPPSPRLWRAKESEKLAFAEATAIQAADITDWV